MGAQDRSFITASTKQLTVIELILIKLPQLCNWEVASLSWTTISPLLQIISNRQPFNCPYHFINAKHQVRSRWRRSRWQNMFAHFIYN